MFTPRENNRLLDYYKIISISRPILARVNMGLDFVSGQYRCIFSRCRKYVINSLIHGHFHIGLVIIHRPILGVSDDNQANRAFLVCFVEYLTKMYVYCIDHAISKSPKQLRNCLQITDTSVSSNCFYWRHLWRQRLFCYCFVPSLCINQVP
jgi:hypothetical protein